MTAVAHCSPEFLGNHGQSCTDCFVADFNNTTLARSVFSAPSHLTSIQWSERERSVLGGGCLNGQTCWFDERAGLLPVGETDFENSHTDAVFSFSWIGKTGTEFFTGSEDGYMKWWDIRNFAKPVKEFLVMTDEDAVDPEKAESVSCLSFEPTIPSKFMVGTRRGAVVSCRMQPKQGSSSMILGVYTGQCRSRVLAVDRNPFYPKNFMVVRDYSTKIWCEDLHCSPIMWVKDSPARLTAGCWSPVRMSVFFTTRVDGNVEVWDFLFQQNKPVLLLKIADHPLQCLKVCMK